MLRWLEIAFAAVLFAYSLILFEPIQQFYHLLIAGAVVWLIALLLFRSTRIVSSSAVFHFFLILAFHLRATMADGRLAVPFLVVAIAQWGIILWLHARDSGDCKSASLFLTISLISPLSVSILNARNPEFPGIALWSLAVLRSYSCASFSTNFRREVNILLMLLVMLSGFAILFSLYPWNSILFLWVNCICIMIYFVVARSKQQQIAIYSGYCFLSASLILYVLWQELPLVPFVGAGLFGMRHHIVEHANTLAPLYIILSGIILHYGLFITSRSARVALTMLLICIAALAFLSYSKSGWAGYITFFVAYFWFLLLRKKTRIGTAVIGGALLFILAILALQLDALRVMLEKRIYDSTSMDQRLLSWRLGVDAVIEKPLFGNGWLNYYAHAQLPLPEPWDRDQFLYRSLNVVHNHSFYLDIADAGGIPLALVMLLFTVVHFRWGLHQPALFAGLAGVTANNLLDTASFWLTVYPHFWVLLGLIARSAIAGNGGLKVKASRWLLMPVVIVSVSLFLSDFFVQRGHLFSLRGKYRQAIDYTRIAALACPLNAVPLEQLTRMYLALEQGNSGKETLQKLTSIRRQFAPYYAQLARLELFQGRLSEAEGFMQKAKTLDPQVSLREDTYLLFAMLNHRQNREEEFRRNLIHYFQSQINVPDFHARILLEQFGEQNFLLESLHVSLERAASPKDWGFAIENVQVNLMALRKVALSEKWIELALENRQRMDPPDVDSFAEGLCRFYAAERRTDDVRRLLSCCVTRSRDLVNARLAISEGRAEEAWSLMEVLLKRYDLPFLSDLWEEYWRKFGTADGLRMLYRIMPRFPLEFPDPAWHAKLGASYYQDGQYSLAARAYNRLGTIQSDSPNPYFWEARMWHLAKEPDKAISANRRHLLRIQSNSILENLYRSDIEVTIPGAFGVWRSNFQNSTGTTVSKVTLAMHPRAAVRLDPELKFSEITGKLVWIDSAWLEQTDGAEFLIQTHSGKPLLQQTLNSTTTGLAGSFQLKTEKPENIVLTTSPMQNPNWDLVGWQFDVVR